MKRKRAIWFAIMAVFSALVVFNACKKEEEPEPVEALITRFEITNAGANADQRVEGSIAGLNITVVVPFETDVKALVPDITVSEGARVIPASGTALDFTNPRNFVVTNEDQNNTYAVTVEKADPTQGYLTNIVFKSVVTGTAYSSEIILAENRIIVTFNSLQSTRVVISEISVIPPGTTYTTSSGTDTLDLSVAGQTITLSFAGKQTVYAIETNITAAGFNPANASLLIDKSSREGLVPPAISNETNRAAEFDGRYVYVVSRQEGNHVYYWDVENPTADPKKLHFTDLVTGGTWVVSDIRLSGKNIYVSNMVMAKDQVFKIYKWDGVEDAEPELVLEYTVPDASIRLGDAISIIGNPSQDGYIYASNFAWPNQASEFYVWKFNYGKAGAPEVIPIKPIEGLRIGQYGRVNTIPGDPDHLLVTGAEMGVGVMKVDGTVIYETYEPMVQSRSYDPRIFEYNDGLYLSYTVNREWEAQGVYYEIINISEGASYLDALRGLSETNIEQKRVSRHRFSGPASVWVGATHAVGFSPAGKPRVMGYAIQSGFVVHELSN